ncbi:MAG TPA: tetratricopeptide repeat protein [Planctomycetota bacterium]|nr:tetratricopeptide repeat protein [Planctomycetota bacterium]
MTRRTRRLHVACLLLAAACGEQPAAGTPTFARDVAPIVYGSCTPCHRPGESAPFPLLGFDDVWKKRKQIVEVTGKRLMPPWLPTHGDFEDDRRLAPEAIETLRAWVEGGAPRGDVAVEPPAPRFHEGWQLREPDLIVRAPEAVVVPAEGPDLFRNLVIPVDVDRVRFVEAVEIRPDSRAVHHAVLGMDPTRESRRLDALDAEPGFPGMTLGGAAPPDGHFLGWTPGKRVHRNPPGMAWRLWPGHDFVLQLHLTPRGKPETVQPQIGLYFTDVPTTIEPVGIVLFWDRIDIAPGATFVLKDHLDLPVAVEVHSIYPHAHFICRSMRGTATLPDHSECVLFEIPAWDFDWQDDYRFRTPIELPAGSRLAIEYVYDNSAANPNNPKRPPRRVQFGQQSTDEMGTLTLMVTVAGREQRSLLLRAAARRDLEKNPDAWNVWLRLAHLEREAGNLPEALDAAQRAGRMQPDLADPWVELGMCQEAAGRLDEAERDYRQALARDPGQGLAHGQLGGLLARAGHTEAAVRELEQALVTLPNMPTLHNNLATAYFVLDRLKEAETHYRRALELEPGYFNAQFNLGRVLAQMGRLADARAALQRADSLRPGDAAVKQALGDLDRR